MGKRTMLIHNYDELNALPADSVVIENRSGIAFQKTETGWLSWETYFKISYADFPLTLLHPRRFDDHDLGTAAAAIEQRRQLNSRADSITLANTVLTALESDTHE